MPPVLRGKSRRKISSENIEDEELSLEEPDLEPKKAVAKGDVDLERYAKEVLNALIKDRNCQSL